MGKIMVQSPEYGVEDLKLGCLEDVSLVYAFYEETPVEIAAIKRQFAILHEVFLDRRKRKTQLYFNDWSRKDLLKMAAFAIATIEMMDIDRATIAPDRESAEAVIKE